MRIVSGVFRAGMPWGRHHGCRCVAVPMTALAAARAAARAYGIGDAGTGSGCKVKAQSFRARAGHEVHWSRPALEVGRGFAPGREATPGTGDGMADGHGGHRLHGSRDMKPALKWELPEVLPASLDWAVEPGIVLPTGSRSAGMGGKGTGTAVPLRASRQQERMPATGLLAWVKRLGKTPAGARAPWSNAEPRRRCGRAWNCCTKRRARPRRSGAAAWASAGSNRRACSYSARSAAVGGATPATGNIPSASASSTPSNKTFTAMRADHARCRTVAKNRSWNP